MALSEQEELELLRLRKQKAQQAAAPVTAKEPDELADTTPVPPTVGPGGAAFGVFPKQRATPSKPETQASMREFAKETGQALGLGVPKEPEMSPGAIAGATGVGTTAGAFGPTALRKAGQFVGKIPTAPTRAAGGLMQALGTGLQSIPTGRRAAAAGAALGGTELTGQLGEQAGVPRAVTGLATLGLTPPLARAGARGLLGAPTATREQYARAAEQLGFKLSPAQVRADIPLPAKGATFSSEKNQKLANELVSASTGKQAAEISPDFVRGRFDALGKEFDKIYSGKMFNIDPQAIQAIESISRIENQLPPTASVSAVKATADQILKNYRSMASRKGAVPGTFSIEGDMLQRLRTDLLGAARSATNRQDAHAIYELVDVIDGSVARNYPQIAAKLEEIRPQYRNTVILEDLIKAGGIRGGDVSLEKLGQVIQARKSGIRSQRDLDKLGEMGRELQLRARWEREGAGATAGESLIGQAIGTAADITGTLTGLRSGPARSVQRFYAE